MLLKMLLCGVLVAIPYVVPQLWFMEYVAFIPVLLIVCGKFGELTKRRSYLYGFVFGIGYYIVMYYWFLHFIELSEAEDISVVAAVSVAFVCWFGLAALQAAELGVAMLLYRLINPKKDKPLLCGIVFAALWVLFEWQQSFFWRGVPFARLALTQANAPIAIQSASLFGSLFVSGIILLVNVLLFVAVKTALKHIDKNGIRSVFRALKNKKTAVFAMLALCVFSANMIFGTAYIAVCDFKKGEPIKTAVIQANISSLEKWSGFYNSFDTYIEMTEECVKETNARLVVWPETVLPAQINLYDEIMNTLRKTANRLDIYLFVGSFASETVDGEKLEYNAVYLFTPNGENEQRYYKQRLVPFGEYNPVGVLMSLVPALDVLDTFNDPLTAGEGTQLIDTEYGRIGSLICFDSIYDYIVKQSVIEGAELITLSTNDSWFSDSTAVWQHNRHAQLRAVENGRYVVRAASTGVSSFISPNGVIIEQIAPLTKGYAVCDVYMLSGKTLYSRIGDVFAYICLGFVTGTVAYKTVIYFKNKKRSDKV